MNSGSSCSASHSGTVGTGQLHSSESSFQIKFHFVFVFTFIVSSSGTSKTSFSVELIYSSVLSRRKPDLILQIQ